MFEARLLGQYELSLDDRPLTFHSRPTQSVFAYFLLHPNINLRREMLAGQFWPASSESNARSNLRHALWNIRKLMGSAAKARLECDELTVVYQPQPDDYLDVDIFTGQPPDETSRDALIRQVSLYKGELLPGFYEEWVSLERERLRADFERKMGKLLDCLLSKEQWDEIIEWGERWIAQGGSPEPAYRALMQAHAGLGNLSASVDVYNRCVEALKSELGVEPSPATREIFEQIRKKRTTNSRVTAAVPQSSKPHQPLYLKGPESPKPIFVGQETELAALEGYLQKALAGRLQIVFVCGEAGSGKSSLLKEFLRRSLTAYPKLAAGIGICNAFFGQGVPYLPFRDILNMLAGDVESLYSNGDVSRNQAMRLLESFPLIVQTLTDKCPELIDSFVGSASIKERVAAILPDNEDLRRRLEEMPFHGYIGREEKSQLFDQFTELLRQMAERYPLLLLLDDLQWMDPETGRLLFHIFRSLQNTRILIVGAYRQDEVAMGRDGEPHPLELLVNEFQSSRGQIRIDLDENRAKTGRQFVDAYLDTELNQLDSSFRQEFYDHTQGHPLFTVQMLRNLQEREEIFRDKEGHWTTSTRLSWENLPPQIEGVIGERIGRLDRDLQEVLTVASVEGEQFTLQVLEGVLKKDVSKVLPCLSHELEKRHRLVQEIGEVTAGGQRLVRFRFAHTLVQQYVYQQLGMTERARLHQQIAECLEGLYKEDIPSIAAALANHYQAAGIKVKAVDYLLLTGDQARSLYAHQEAIRCYQLAIKYLKEIGAEDQEAHTLMKLYLVYHNSFDYSRAQQTLKEYEVLTRKISDHRRIQNSSAMVYSYRLGVIKKPLLDPAFSDSLFDLELLREIFCGLVELSGDRNLIPWVSRHWDVLDGGCRYIFHLRDDFLWNDGVVVTADDFEFAWKRVLDPATHALSANLLFNIAGARDFHLGYSDSVGISAPDRFTLEVRLEEPCGYFPYVLGDPIAFAVPKHVIEKKGDAWTKPEWYVTNGAFQLDPHNQPGDKSARFVRNPYYAGPYSGNVSDVTLFSFQNEVEMYQAFISGELDLVEFLIPQISREELDRYRRLGQLYISSVPFVDSIFFITDRPPFNNPNLRRAFVLATDRERLAREVENMLPATGGYIPPYLPGHSDENGLPYDPEEARRLLATAGYPQGEGFPPVGLLLGLVGLEKGDNQVFESLKAMWQENLGITLRKCQGNADNMDLENRDDFNFFFIGWLADYPDPASFLESNYLIDFCHWKSAVYDALIEQGHHLLDQSLRLAQYRQADRVLMQEAVVLPLFYGHIYEIRQPWVQRLSGSSIYNPQWKDTLLNSH